MFVFNAYNIGFTSPNGACLALKDEDTTNTVEGEWKQLNTLEHYKVGWMYMMC